MKLNGHAVALWAGVASFFATLLAIGIFDVFDPEQWVQYLGAVIVALITAGAVYSQQRLEDAKRARAKDDGTTYTPEEHHDPLD